MNRFLEQIKAVFVSLPPGRRVGALSLIGAVIVGTIFLVLWINKPHYQPLFSKLSEGDAGIILSKLKEKRIPYKISKDGGTILVPEDNVYELRLTMASEGLPQGGAVGFEIFDETHFGRTEFVEKLNYQRALEGELARTVGQFPEVEQVRVHIVIPKESLFIEDKKESTASVVLKVRSGMRLKTSQIEGIAHLVASAVEGLESEQVTIVDVSGKVLYKTNEGTLTGKLTNTQLEYQRNVEENLQKKVKTMLERVIGAGKAIAQVSADMDFEQVNIVEEVYDPDSVVARSRQTSCEISERAGSIPMGIPEVEEETKAGTTSGKKPNELQRQNEIVNYEINKVSRQITGAVGEIKRLSVAVVIDGDYKDIGVFEDMVKKAVGFDERRGDQVEVSCISFAAQEYEEAPPPQKAGWKEYVGKASKPLFNGILLLLVFLFVVRPLIKWITRRAEEVKLPQELPITAGELEHEISKAGERVAVVREQIFELAKTDPEKSIRQIKAWLKEKE